MRVKLKESVDFKNELDLKALSPMDRIRASVKASVYNSNIVQTQLEKQEKKKLEEQAKNVKILKESLSQVATDYLVQQESDYTRDTGKKIKVIEIFLPRKFEESLKILLDSRDFDSFNIKRVKENPLILKCKPSLPIRLLVSQKVL